MDDVSTLVIQVASEDVAKGAKHLDDLTQHAEKAEHSVEGLGKATDVLKDLFKEIIGPLLTIEGVFKGLEKIVEVTKEVETLQAKLKTAVGSTEGAKEAFEALEEISSKLPDSMAETTAAFIKLQQNGLDPSKAALESYANVASATGGSLLGVAEAVTQAVNGQMRGLHQLGITAINEADGVTLIFRGTATKIKGDAQSIQDYIKKIGETDFAGATAERAKGMEGSIKELSFAWEQMWKTISELGAGDLMKEAFHVATVALDEFTGFLKSRQAASYVSAIGIAFEDLRKMVYSVVGNISEFLHFEFAYWSTDGRGAVDFLIDAFLYLPENVAAVIKVTGATIEKLIDAVTMVGGAVIEAYKNAFRVVVELSENTGKALAHNLNPLNFEKVSLAEYIAQQVGVVQKYESAQDGLFKSTVLGLDSNIDAWEAQVSVIEGDREATIKAFNEKITAGNKLRQTYEDIRKAAANSNKDPLGGFTKPRGNDNVDEASRRAFDELKKSLQLQEVYIEEEYKKRTAIILKNTKEGSTEQLDLLKRLNTDVQIELDKASDAHEANVIGLQAKIHDAMMNGQSSQLDTLQLSLQKEEDALRESYDVRRKIILADTKLTEEQRQQQLAQLSQKQTQQQREIEIARNKQTLDTAADFFGNLSKIAGAFGSKGAKIAKAAAIVQATIKTYESATSAYAAMAGIPYIGPVLGAAAAGAAIAAGLANISMIKSQNYSGSYATGGMIPAGKWGITQEAGFEVTQGPTTVQSARSTADRQGSAKPQTNVFVNITNQTDAQATVTERDTSQGKMIDVVIKRVKGEIASDLRTGGTTVSRAIEGVYGLNRGRNLQ